ncbi:MAG: hypothetical protein R2834_17580 [Rhodothermales bacterium]
MFPFVIFLFAFGFLFGVATTDGDTPGDTTKQAVVWHKTAVSSETMLLEQHVIDTAIKARQKKAEPKTPYPHNLEARDGYSAEYARRMQVPAPIIPARQKAAEPGDPQNI